MSKERVKWLLDKVAKVNDDDDLAIALGHEFGRLREENRYYRGTLKFYADKENYKSFVDIMRAKEVTMILEDSGKKAREAINND